MRKMMLAVTGVGAGGVMLMIFFACILCQCIPAQASAEGQMQRQTVSFPITVAGTSLRVVQLARYDGPFCEDGSDDPVVGVAALVVENTGDLMVEEGAVVLEWEGRTMVFELSFLPIGSRVLVLEKDRQSFPDQAPENCYGWSRQAYTEDMGQALVHACGDTISVTNRTCQTLPVVQVCYKSWDPKSGLLLGGVAYVVEIRNLEPGQRQIITPYHYVFGGSRVICTTVYVEK